MKVILKQDVATLGKRGATVEVSEGYARNFLMPRGLVVEASEGALKVLAMEKKVADNKTAKEEAEAKALGEKLGSVEVVVPAKMGEGGRLFGSVTAKDIVEALAKQKIKLDKKKLELEEPLKHLGTYEVPVKLHPKVRVNLKVQVVSA